MRQQNIIIQGINEGKLTDAQYLAKFCGILEVDHTSLRASHRLRMKKCDKQRLLKIVMKSVEEKENVMARLSRLRAAKDDFRKISVM